MACSIYVKAVFNASFVIELNLQMMNTKNTATPKLYIGIDMHKSSWTVRMSTDLFQGRKLRMPSDPEKLYDHVSHIPAPPAIELHLHGARAMAYVALLPGEGGGYALAIVLADGGAGPLAAEAVTVALALPERGVERRAFDARPGADGVWRAGPVALPVAGRWRVAVEILVDPFTRERLDGVAEIGR
jgi:hypothetical protein